MQDKKKFTAALLFLLFIFGMFVYLLLDARSISDSILQSYRNNRPQQPTVLDKVTLSIDAFEPAVGDSADRTHLFIQLFGGAQRLLDKRVIDDADPENLVARLDTGALQFVSKNAARQDMTASAANLIRLGKALAKENIPLLYVNAPQKIQEGADALPTGISEYGNPQADELLSRLKAGKISVLDLRDSFQKDADYAANFFVTDHHWKPEAAFRAFQSICKALQNNYGFAVDPAVTDYENYSVTVYPRYFLGSQGKRVGTLYAGLDDISLIAPRFATSLTYDVPSYGIRRTGNYLNSVIFLERVKTKDYFNDNPYLMYAGGDYGLATAVNHLNPNGPRVLLVRDSFACALTPFLALACGRLQTVDLRYFTGSLEDTILREKPDLVLYLYCTSTTSHEALYQVN